MEKTFVILRDGTNKIRLSIGLAQKDAMVCTVPQAKRPDVTLDFPM
jgi:hypothetical protein